MGEGCEDEGRWLLDGVPVGLRDGVAPRQGFGPIGVEALVGSMGVGGSGLESRR